MGARAALSAGWTPPRTAAIVAARVSRLANPELAWEPPVQARSVDRAEIEARVGTVDAPIEVLGGGLANVNVRIGDRVLRIHRRDPAAAGREAALLERRWTSFRVPELLARGHDFALLRHVPHRPLDDLPAHGAAVGRALAEIHANRFPDAGFLDDQLAIATPMHDVVGAFHDHVLAGTEGPWGQLRAAIAGALRAHAGALRALAAGPVLLHGDFKVSNLHWTERDELLVLDWEFAYAGPALMDIGQLTRWSPSPAFLDAFAGAYRDRGGALPPDWLRWAATFDLVNLSGLLEAATPDSARGIDVSHRIGETLAALGPG